MVPDWVIWLSLGIAIFGVVVGLVFGLFALAAWLNQRPSGRLELALADPSFGDAAVLNAQGAPARFFHLSVRNRDDKRIARNCYAYLVSLKQAGTNNELLVQGLPLKWRGVPTFPYESIPSNSERRFDAFWILIGQPDRLLLNAFVDSSQLVPNVAGPVDLIAVYRVISENFTPREGTFVIHLDSKLNAVCIRKG